ncbi:MAG: PKD domain-containing protein [Bacteroidia bacterium]|nr:PKD domain-containing protein [Bacteroidia bacterium]
MMKTHSTLFLLLAAMLPNWVLAQTPCFFPGSDSRWETRFAQPGITTGTVYALVPSQDGSLIVGTSAISRFGGDLNLGSIARWDGKKYTPLATGLNSTTALQSIRAVAEDANGNVYVGGNFSGATNPNGTVVSSKNIIRWNITTQQWEALGAGVNNQVYAIAIDQNNVYIGGTFTLTESASPISIEKVARFDVSTSTWSAMGSGVGANVSFLNGQVNALQIGNNGEVFVGGAISTAGGQPINSIARWTPGSGWDNVGGGLASFAIDANGVPTGVSFPSTVQSLAFHPTTGKLYAGGFFGEYIGSAGIAQTKGLAEWNGTTWTLIDGVGIPSGSNNFSVHALLLDPAANKLYVGGTFFQYVAINPLNSPAGNGIMSLNLTNNTWDTMGGGIQQGASAGGTVFSIALYQGKVYAGGSFASLNKGLNLANNLVAYDGSTWDNLGDGVNGSGGDITDIVSYNGDLIVAGTFSKVDDKEIQSIARWNETTGWDTLVSGFFGNSSSNFNSIVYDLYRDGANLYIGGFFGGLGTITTTGILRYNLVAGTFTSWGTGLGGSFARTFDFEKFQGSMYMAGSFTSVNGTPITHLAKLTASGWVSVGTFNNQVHALVNDGDSVLYAVGNFTQIDGNTAMSRAAKYNGTSWSPVGQGITNGQVFTVAIDPITHDIYFGGTISTCKQSNGTNIPIRRLARWDGTTWSQADNFTNDLTFTRINDLEFDASGTLYLTGGFEKAGGETVNSIMRWNPAFGIAGFGSGLNSNASSTGTPGETLALIDSFLYVVGSFYRAGDAQSSRIARYLLDDPADGAIVVDLGPDTTACGPVILDAGLTGVNFVWNTGEQTQTITAATTGWYSVIAFNGNCSDEDSVFVTVGGGPTLAFASDTLSSCDSVVIDGGPGFAHYLWNTGDTTRMITVNDNDLIRLTVTDANGCTATDSLFAEVTGYSPTAFFETSVVGDTALVFDGTESFAGTSYTWDYGDGSTGTGQISNHTYASNGSYTATLIVSNDCGSDTITKTVIVDFLLGIQAPAYLQSLRVFPNPSQGLLHLNGDLDRSRALTVQVLDLRGRVMYAEEIRTNGAALSHAIDLPSVSPGLYFLEISSDEGSITFKVRIE